jgi:hypothetical protein
VAWNPVIAAGAKGAVLRRSGTRGERSDRHK